MRITHIDGIRGFFLVSMTVGHLSFVTSSLLGRLTHHTAGFIDAAQGFVAFSGLVIGLVYGQRLLSRSAAEMRRSLAARMRTLWLWNFVLSMLVAATVPSLPNIPVFLSENLGNAPWIAALMGMGLVSGLWGVEVLAAYLVFMALTPAALVAMQQGKWPQLVLASLATWILAQTGLAGLVLDALSGQIGLDRYGLSIGLYFNRLGWQVLYFGGLAIGFRMAQGRFDTGFLHSRAGHLLLLPCLALIALFYLNSILVAQGWPGHEGFVQALQSAFDRENMTLLRIGVFGAYLYLGLWLLIVGGTARARPVRLLSGLLHALASWRPLVLLGQHSLQVFAWQACLVYLFAAFVAPRLVGGPAVIHEAAVILAAISLFIPALLNDRYRAAQRNTAARPVGAQAMAQAGVSEISG